MKININGKDYEAKNNMKAMLVFEGLTEKAFELKTLTDICQYEFCMLYANIASVRSSLVFLIYDDNATVLFRKFLQDMQRIICRAIINTEYFNIGQCLLADTI
jgi:hypothetical protein